VAVAVIAATFGSLSGIWQDFAEITHQMVIESMAIRRGTARFPAATYC
jgi:hypothetical protein